MTQEEAVQATGLGARQYTNDDGKVAFLQCQLGRMITEQRPNVRTGGTLPAPVFHVKGFGYTWEQAVARVKKADHGPRPTDYRTTGL